MRPGIDFLVSSQTSAPTDHSCTAADFGVHPNFVGIHRSLSEWMPELESAYHDLEQEPLAGPERLNGRAQRSGKSTVDLPPLFDAEDIYAQRSLEEILLRLHNVRLAPDIGDAGIGRREQMIVNIPGRQVRR